MILVSNDQQATFFHLIYYKTMFCDELYLKWYFHVTFDSGWAYCISFFYLSPKYFVAILVMIELVTLDVVRWRCCRLFVWFIDSVILRVGLI